MAKNCLIVVRNVFKNKDEETLKNEYNKKWIELINQLEKSRNILLGNR